MRSLLPDQIHIWQGAISDAQASVPAFETLLSADERTRAARFRFQRDRDCYVVSRGILRQLLAQYCGSEADRIRFDYGAQGKPALAEGGAGGLQFNVSHSGDRILFAFALELPVGVDVEYMQSNVDFAGLARSSFSPTERDRLVALDLEHRAGLFYEYWTCKEACIKGDGRGLSVPLSEFSIVPSRRGAQWREVITTSDRIFPAAWSVRIIETSSGYAAAVAAAGHSWDIVELNLGSPTDSKN